MKCNTGYVLPMRKGITGYLNHKIRLSIYFQFLGNINTLFIECIR